MNIHEIECLAIVHSQVTGRRGKETFFWAICEMYLIRLQLVAYSGVEIF